MTSEAVPSVQSPAVVDISPEAVEALADSLEALCLDVSPHIEQSMRDAAHMVHDLRLALTASGSALRKYGSHRPTCAIGGIADFIPPAEGRALVCDCGFSAELEKANG